MLKIIGEKDHLKNILELFNNIMSKWRLLHIFSCMNKTLNVALLSSRPNQQQKRGSRVSTIINWKNEFKDQIFTSQNGSKERERGH